MGVGCLEKLRLRLSRVTEKSARIYPLGRIMWTGVNAARRGELCTEIARVRLVGRGLFLLDLNLWRHPRLGRLHFCPHLFYHFERVHVDIAIRAELGAFFATDTPVFDQDFEVLFSPDRTDWALSHAKRIPAGAAGSGNQIMIVAQTVPQKAGHTIVRIGTSPHTGVATGAVVEIDQEKILRFE